MSETNQSQFENKRIIYRQGDVLLIRIDYTDLEDVVKYGEYVNNKLEIMSENGHAHTMEGIKVFRYYGRQVVVVEKPTVLAHEQHPSLVIQPGIYELRFVRDWLLRESRPVD